MTSLDLGNDLVGGLLPDERLRIFIPVLGPDSNRGFELSDRRERALLQAAVSELAEPTLDEIEPRRTRRCEAQVPSSTLGCVDATLHLL